MLFTKIIQLICRNHEEDFFKLSLFLINLRCYWQDTKKTQKQKPRKLRLRISNKGKEKKIEL